MIALVLAGVLLADPPPPIVIVPPGPQPVPALQTLNPTYLYAVTLIDTVCDHGNRIYRSLETKAIAVVPRDPSCPGGQ